MASTASKSLGARFRVMSQRSAAQPSMDLREIRDMQEGLHFETAEPEDVSYAEVDADGVPALWCNPHNASETHTLLYFHGGGFVTNSMHSHRKLAAHLARAVGARALVPDYRLAPEHPFPAQLDDARTAYRWLLSQGFLAGQIATAGDSAGGNLSTSIALKLREEGTPLPGAIIAFSPWYDMEVSGASVDTNASTDELIQRSGLEEMVKTVLGEHGSPMNPFVNPLHADVAGLPPLYLTVGSDEVLVDDATRMADKATMAGVEVTLEIGSGMQHVYQLMAGRAPEANDSIRDAASWLRPKLGLL